MFPIDTRTATELRPPIPDEGKPGWFTHGDPEKGEVPTVVDADWMNRIQSELMNVVTGANITLKKDDSHQLLEAIRLIARSSRYVPGQIIAFAGKASPNGTLLCNGATVSRKDYADLFSAIGEIYGKGDGKTNFKLPLISAGLTLLQASTPSSVGRSDGGAVKTHNHTGTINPAEGHVHEVMVEAGGLHNHGASIGAVGDHAHQTWTDQQGWHGHGGSTSADGIHTHTYQTEIHPNPDGAGKGDARTQGNTETWPAGHHAHGVGIDGNGAHGHNIGMNGAGSHAHSVSIAQGGQHSHTARVSLAGSHDHEIAISDNGGALNLAAGLNVLYCIAY